MPRISTEEFRQLRRGNAHSCKISPTARVLLNIRLFAGRLLGWDHQPATERGAFATRLTTADPLESLVPPGTPVRNVNRFTRLYMSLIDPFRKHIVYPSLLLAIRTTWDRTFGAA